MAKASQLVLDIAFKASFAAEDYVPGHANQNARSLVENLQWPTPIGLLIGEPGSGKSHLAHLFAAQYPRNAWFDGSVPEALDAGQALIIDGLEQWIGKDEDIIFHTLESARANQAPTLVTTRVSPETSGLQRPDTISRLRAGVRADISQPDDALFSAIAVKQFTDRQLMIDPDIAHYLLQRMERSYANLQQLIALIDQQSLAAGRAITKPLARDVLAAYELSQS